MAQIQHLALNGADLAQYAGDHLLFILRLQPGLPDKLPDDLRLLILPDNILRAVAVGELQNTEKDGVEGAEHCMGGPF